jgi:competence protein ComEA
VADVTVTRPQLAVYVAAALAILLIGARYLHDSRPAPAARSSAPAAVRVRPAGDGWATVQVAGAVRRPGVYRLRTGQRVDDAVQRAGGLRPGADLTGVNLAAKLEDGRQVIVPERGAAQASAAGAAPGAVAPGAATAPAAPINLNTATAEQLDQLDGVGPVTAQKILAYRQAHGGFRSVAELGQVPGIGEKRLAALRQRVRV